MFRIMIVGLDDDVPINNTFVSHAQRLPKQFPFASTKNQRTKAKVVTAWSSNHQQSPYCSCHQHNSVTQALEQDFDQTLVGESKISINAKL